MKVLFDYQIFYLQKIGGISRYYAEMISRLPAYGVEIDIGVAFSNNKYLKEICHLDHLEFKGYEEFMKKMDFKGKHKLYELLAKTNIIKDYFTINQELSLKYIDENKFDIFHPTFYKPYFLSKIGNKPFVLTILDMITNKFSNNRSSAAFTDNQRILANKAAKIVVISESTKNDVVSILGIKPEKIEVIYLGNSLRKITHSNKLLESFKEQLPTEYILFVGHRGGYKNFDTFVEAVSPILKEHEHLKVVCTGPAFSNKELNFLKNRKLHNHFIHFFASENQLTILYEKAECFVFPSKYEGFGIPILEAFANNCPVVLSNSSSLPEVAGNAALYFDPNSVMEMRSAIKKVLFEKSLRANLIMEGQKQLLNFSWDSTAKQTAKLYQSIY